LNNRRRLCKGSRHPRRNNPRGSGPPPSIPGRSGHGLDTGLTLAQYPSDSLTSTTEISVSMG
jgi:hypothetical protein